MPAARAASSREAPSSTRASIRREAAASRHRLASRRSPTAPGSFRVIATVMTPPPIGHTADQPRRAPRGSGRDDASAIRAGGMSRPLRRLLARGLADTEGMWPPIRRAYAWVHRAARLLANAAGEPALARRLDRLLAAMARHRAKAGPLAGAVDHFREVTRSYRPGLFHGYAVADLPRTNNALEQLFGSYRRHERRATGRKANSSATVLRGPVRL